MKQIFTLSVVVCACLVAACSKSSPSAGGPPPGGPGGAEMPVVAVRVVTATATDVPLEIAAIGNVEAMASVDVKARVTAPVLKVHFAEGQDVKAGDLLFELDPETWNRQISEIEANVAKDVANEKQAEANIAKDQATLKNAQSMADRASSLNKEGILSKEQTDQLVSTADAAKASLDSNRAALESARAAGKADRARLDQTKLLLGYTKVYAPMTGRAGVISVKAGNLAKADDTTMVQLLQTSPIYASFSVPEDFLPQIRGFGSTGTLAVQATTPDGKESTGTLKFIDNSVDATTGTIRLKAAFDNQQHLLWPGQFVNVKARLSIETGRLVVPSRTVQSGPQGKYLWVLNADSTAAIHPVQVLRNFTPKGGEELAVIGSGLNLGDRVVSEGQLRLAPGAKVRVLATAAPTSGS